MADLPRDFGRYRLTTRLGVGGMAEVYRAEMRGGSNREVAIKRIALGGHDRALDDMLLDEARIWRRLKHPNVVEVLEFGLQEDDWFLALELVEGASLADVLKTVDVLPVNEALYITEKVAQGLAHAHTRTDERGRPLKIVHRDVKPANILISSLGEVKLTDFGIARAADRISRTQAGVIKGSLYFLSPEQARGETVDARSDIFSLGCVLHVMLTGNALIDLPDDEQLFEALTAGRIPQPPESLPASVRTVLRALTAADPRDRPADAAEAATLIRGAVEVGASLTDAEAFVASRVQQLMDLPREEPATDATQKVAMPIGPRTSGAVPLAGPVTPRTVSEVTSRPAPKVEVEVTSGSQPAVTIDAGTDAGMTTDTSEVPLRTQLSAVPVRTDFSPFGEEEPNDPSVTIKRARPGGSPPAVSPSSNGGDATVIVPSRDPPSTTAPAIRAPGPPPRAVPKQLRDAEPRPAAPRGAPRRAGPAPFSPEWLAHNLEGGRGLIVLGIVGALIAVMAMYLGGQVLNRLAGH